MAVLKYVKQEGQANGALSNLSVKDIKAVQNSISKVLLAYIGGGRVVLEYPQLSRLRYSNRAVTLIQQSVKNSYSLLILQLIAQKPKLYYVTSNAPKFNLLAQFFKNFLWGSIPPDPPR